ncbi:hypothetical protein [uncultured Bacteroides sp.]|uniref:hypothetical protein n=1 Tax=uncultured Bacteroides sp. TaxID=162156 RepID=UPI002AAB5675|nr:hypothetical protein [uncultured Bacteroides sp.]
MKIAHTTSTSNDMTLVDIVKKRIELKHKITLQKEKIANTSTELFAPLSSFNSGKPYLNYFKNSINILNGAILGYKLMKKFRHFFHKKG